MEQFNTQQENSIKQFNAQQQNAVAQFNASNGLVVSQANAEWRRNIATIDTAAQNQVNQFNAQNAMALTVREYEGMWQEFRDKMQFAHNSAESQLDRENQYAIAIMQKDAQIEAAKFGMKADLYKALGGVMTAGAQGMDFGSIFKSAWNMITGKGGEEVVGGTGGGAEIDTTNMTPDEYMKYLDLQDVDIGTAGGDMQSTGGVGYDEDTGVGVDYVPSDSAVEYDPSKDVNVGSDPTLDMTPEEYEAYLNLK